MDGEVSPDQATSASGVVSSDSRQSRPPIDQEFQRAYKACETCRKRKSRCILSAEDYAANKPCARCRRELRECVFSVGRHTKSRKVTRQGQERHDQNHTERDMERGGGMPALRRLSSSRIDHQTRTPPNRDTLVRTVVSSGNDALNLLFEAAHHTEAPINESSSQPGAVPEQRAQPVFQENPGSVYTAQTPATSSRPTGLPHPTSDVLRIWKACRFIKMGWFTAEEAVYLVDMYAYRPLACRSLTIVSGFTRI